MKKNITITIIIILAVIILGVWTYSVNNNINTRTSSGSLNNNYANPISPNTQNGNQAGQLFSDSPLAQSAYLISGTTYDANTKKALTGFTVAKKALTDGSTQITLNAQNPEYKTQTYIVKPGEKLYFIEKNLSDDSGDTDKFLGDDQAVLVDVNGYIVQ